MTGQLIRRHSLDPVVKKAPELSWPEGEEKVTFTSPEVAEESKAQAEETPPKVEV